MNDDQAVRTYAVGQRGSERFRWANAGSDDLVVSSLTRLLHLAASDPDTYGVEGAYSMSTEQISSLVPVMTGGLLAVRSLRSFMPSAWVEVEALRIPMVRGTKRAKATGVRSKRAWMPFIVGNDE